MNTLYHNLCKSIIIVSVWWLALGIYASYRVASYGVNPTFPYYNTLLEEVVPSQAVWAHFDGAHYLHLAKLGYDGTGVQAFFPVYPAMTRMLGESLGISYITAGLLISWMALIGALLCLMSLFGNKWNSVVATLLLFPTSFFLSSMYTESLFLFEVLLFFVLLKRRSYLGAALVAGLASGTRLVGATLAISLLIELYHRPLSIVHRSFLTILSLSGFILYALYLWQRYGDPLMFLHVQSLFGAERSSGEIVLLPQVLVRYIKMVFTVDPTTWLYQRVWIELLAFLGATWLWYKNLRSITPAQSAFVGLSILIPTLSGTLSSFPRYALILVPFLIPPTVGSKKILIWLICSAVLLLYLTALFAGGTFVA